ncbi:MAG TPA: GNAT family N-acetyltransferase [Gammaproteobacteria bacterium]|nr:GNAT family N-acetyltransferase [Gammaproteobacteria bacterium]
MTDTITRTHFARHRDEFNENGIIKSNSFREIVKPTPEQIVERVFRIPWNWINKEIYDADILPDRIVNQKMRLFDLLDNGREVGYVIAVDPEIEIRRTFLKAMACSNPVEIENIALFPKQTGKGRGRSFLNLIEKKLFSDGHDVVYLNTSETNFPMLPDFYNRVGMTCLGEDEVADFNKRQRAQILKLPPRRAEQPRTTGALISQLT